MTKFPRYKSKVKVIGPNAARRRRIESMLRNLNLDRKADLQIVLDPDIKYAVTTTTIKINPNLPTKEFDTTTGHELLHYLGIPHAEHTRRVGYSSTTLRKDHLSKAIARIATRQKR